jgi:hypothetical protein
MTDILVERVGASRVNGPFSRLSVESLPLFFQQHVAVRGEKSNTRMFFERYRNNHLPRDMMEYGLPRRNTITAGASTAIGPRTDADRWSSWPVGRNCPTMAATRHTADVQAAQQ